MIINDLDGYYIVFDTKNWNTELDTLVINVEFSGNSKVVIDSASFKQLMNMEDEN